MRESKSRNRTERSRNIWRRSVRPYCTDNGNICYLIWCFYFCHLNRLIYSFEGIRNRMKFFYGDLFLIEDPFLCIIRDVEAFTWGHILCKIVRKYSRKRTPFFVMAISYLYVFRSWRCSVRQRNAAFDRGHVYLFAIYFFLSGLPTEK